MLNNTFVISAQKPWTLENKSVAEHLAIELAKFHKVLYVNPPSESLRPSTKQCSNKESKHGRALKQISKNIWLLDPPMVKPLPQSDTPQSIIDYLNKISTRHYSRIINWAVGSLGFRNNVLINDNDPVRNYLLSEYMNPWLSIFYYHDPSPFIDIKPSYLKASNIIVTSSQSLAERVRPYNFNTFNIGYGVDFSPNETGLNNEELFDEIPMPRIGVIAPLNSKELSTELLHHTALKFPLCSLVLAGEMDQEFTNHPLLKLPNVFTLPKSDYDLIEHMNICLNPQYTDSLSLIQSKEQIIRYLSEGKSVVSTNSLSANDLSPYVYMASNQTNFLDLVEAALEEKLSEKTINSRIKFAKNMSWENCANRIFSIINMFENELRDSYGRINDEKSLV